MTNLGTGSWRRIVRLFEQVSNLPIGEQAAFLASCGETPEIVSEARALLESDAAATDGFLSPPARRSDSAEDLGADTVGDKVRDSVRRLDRLGPYRLVSELGRGGMGTVYLGERDDGQFDDRVAVKLLHGIQTPEQRRRFLVERQILASLRHPHIAYLLDGGLGEEDRPYLVMELVDGGPIDRYCRQRELAVGERLRLFLQVASAVEHAHRNLIVHRDLKPSNVMVVGEGDEASVKLLDFGIAKLLDPAEPGLTRTGHRMMTPSYASPEQVRGDLVTTSSDVYQLGFLLYELLTGRRPYRASGSSPFLLAQAILESDPEAPSQAASRSRRTTGTESQAFEELLAPDEAPAHDFLALPKSQRFDLDAILLTALAKEPERRYASVRELADDVERFLDGRPVEARGQGRLYRFGKWVRRNKAATLAAVASLLLVVSVTVLGILALAQSRSLAEERDRAEAEARKASHVADFLGDVFAGANPELHDGDEPTARDLLELGASRIDQLEAPSARRQLSAIMARAFSSLGDQEKAQELALERLRLARLDGSSAEVAEALEELATIGQFTGRHEEALHWLAEAEAIREASASSDPLSLAGCLRIRGELEREQGRWSESEVTLDRALGVYSEAGQDTGSEDAERGRARALSVLAGTLQYLGRLDEAVAAQQEALEIYEEVDADSRALLLDSRHTLALLL